MQVRAIGEAASDQIAADKDPKVEIMVPLVGSVMELHLVRDETEQILADVADEKEVTLTIPIGTMTPLVVRPCRVLGLVGGLAFRLVMAPEPSPG